MRLGQEYVIFPALQVFKLNPNIQIERPVNTGSAIPLAGLKIEMLPVSAHFTREGASCLFETKFLQTTSVKIRQKIVKPIFNSQSSVPNPGVQAVRIERSERALA